MTKKRTTLTQISGSFFPVVHAKQVHRARKKALPEPKLIELTKLFKALADPTRVRLVMALLEGELCVYDLAAVLDISESATSHQLRTLRESALIKSRREGQVIYYSLDDEHVGELLRIGHAHIAEKSRKR